MLPVTAHQNIQYSTNRACFAAVVSVTVFVALLIFSNYLQSQNALIVRYTSYAGLIGTFALSVLMASCTKVERNIDNVDMPGQVNPRMENKKPQIKVTSWDIRNAVKDNQLVGSSDEVFNSDLILLQGTYNLSNEALKLNFPDFDFLKSLTDCQCQCLFRKNRFTIIDRAQINPQAQYLLLEERNTQAKILAFTMDLKNLSSDHVHFIPTTIAKIPATIIYPAWAIIGIGAAGESLETFQLDCNLYFKGRFQNAVTLNQKKDNPFDPSFCEL